MNIKRPLMLPGFVLLVLLVQRPALAFESCDIFDTECAVVTLSTIADAADQVQFDVNAFKAALQGLGDPRARVIYSMVNRLGAKAGQIQTIADVAISNLGTTTSQDIAALMLLVMGEASKDIENDLRMIIAEVKAMTAAKEKFRDLISIENHDVANDFNNVVTGASELVALIRCPVCDV